MSPSTNTSPLPICIVTVDSATGKNLIIWQQTTNPSIVSYNLYKVNSSSAITFIKNIPRSDLSTFIDNASNPAQLSSMYNISMIDSCGFESPFGLPISTIHLTVSAGISPSWNLNWNSTQGFSILKYRIWRATTTAKPALIDSVAAFVYAYTDLTPPSGVLYYTIEAVSNTACIPSKAQTYRSSFSNMEKTSGNGINSIIDISNISIYPNPANDDFFISITSGKSIDASIRLFDIYGREVNGEIKYPNHSIKVDSSTLSEGVYFMQIKTAEGVLVKKVTLAR